MSNLSSIVLNGTYEEISEKLSTIITDKVHRELLLSSCINFIERSGIVIRNKKQTRLKKNIHICLDKTLKIMQYEKAGKLKNSYFAQRYIASQRKSKITQCKTIAFDLFDNRKKVPARIIGTKKYHFRIWAITILIFSLIMGFTCDCIEVLLSSLLGTVNKISQEWDKKAGEQCVVDFITTHKRLPHIKEFEGECGHVSYACNFKTLDGLCDAKKMLIETVNNLYNKKLLVVKFKKNDRVDKK